MSTPKPSTCPGGRRANVAAPANGGGCEDCKARERCVLRILKMHHGDLAPTPRRRRCRNRERLFCQGEDCREVIVVARGIVSLRQLDRAGAVVAIEHAGVGRLLDCRALMARARHMASARSQAVAEVCSAPAEAVRSLIAMGGPAVSEFIEQAGDQLEAAHRASQLRSHRSAVTRVCLALQMLAEAHGRRGEDGWHLDLPLNRIELATLVGARPETISRTISILEQSGLARFSGRHVDIPSLELLAVERLGVKA